MACSELRPLFLLFLFSAPVAVCADGSRSAVALHLVDDRGKPVESPLEVCFYVELRTECKRYSPGEQVYAPGSFHGLRIEGENHGPVTLRRERMKALPDGSFRVLLARKALLRVETGPRQKPLTLSLYSPQDPTFREPFFRVKLDPGAVQIHVPAGDFVAALTVLGDAPDLQRLAAPPGGQSSMTYRQRDGWSVVVRCVAAATGRLVRGAAVKVADDAGFGRPERPLAQAVAGTDGLALISGLAASTASLSVRHPDFLATNKHGLTAGPGTFAFREESLEVGGHLQAHVSVHGRPLLGATCEILVSAPESAARRKPERKIWEGSVDANGVCRTGRLASGSYKLRVKVPQGTAQVGRWVYVREAQDADEDLALASTHVSGTVRRGGHPASTYRVRAALIDAEHPEGMRADSSSEATSDEEGKYDLTLWTRGWYGLRLRSPAGAPVGGHKEVTAEGDDEQKVDFDLAATSVSGTVVDEAGSPIAEANVGLIGWASGGVVDSDTHGRFAFDVEGPGTGTLHAHKVGYQTSEALPVTVEEGAATSPVTIVLKRASTARGILLSAAGIPVPGAWVASIETRPEQGANLYASSRSQDDGSFEVEIPAGLPHLFASGPGCPLSWYDLPAPGAPALAGNDLATPPPTTLTCPEQPAALELTLADDKGKPIVHAALILRRGGTVVPRQILTDHLAFLGLPAETDGAGHLILAGISPGEYDLFLSSPASEGSIAAGLRWGYLTAVSLPALETTELQIAVQP